VFRAFGDRQTVSKCTLGLVTVGAAHTVIAAEARIEKQFSPSAIRAGDGASAPVHGTGGRPSRTSISPATPGNWQSSAASTAHPRRPEVSGGTLRRDASAAKKTQGDADRISPRLFRHGVAISDKQKIIDQNLPFFLGNSYVRLSWVNIRFGILFQAKKLPIFTHFVARDCGIAKLVRCGALPGNRVS
jgi:hypothetical protein